MHDSYEIFRGVPQEKKIDCKGRGEKKRDLFRGS